MAEVRVKKSRIDLEKLSKDFEDLVLRAGWFEGAKYPTGTPVAYVATIQEFGSAARSIPPRSFFRPTIESKKKEWIAAIEWALKKYVKGEQTAVDVLDTLGLVVVGDVKEKITEIYDPPLSPVTLALRKRKELGETITGTRVGQVARAVFEGKTGQGQLGEPSSNTKPLVEYAIMLNTLTHLVEKKDESQ